MGRTCAQGLATVKAHLISLASALVSPTLSSAARLHPGRRRQPHLVDGCPALHVLVMMNNASGLGDPASFVEVHVTPQPTRNRPTCTRRPAILFSTRHNSSSDQPNIAMRRRRYANAHACARPVRCLRGGRRLPRPDTHCWAALRHSETQQWLKADPCHLSVLATIVALDCSSHRIQLRMSPGGLAPRTT